MKQRLAELGLGIVILGAVLGFAFFVSNDMRLVYALGAVLLLASAALVGRNAKITWVTLAFLCLPLIAAFGLLVLEKMPVLWPHKLFWALSAIIGSHLLHPRNRRLRLSILSVGLLVIASLWYCLGYMPGQVSRRLNKFKDAAAPAFTFEPVSKGPVPTQPTAGKVLVIDFFSTTCGPCIAELPELAKASAELRERSDIEFVVVASDAGGDTRERFQSFVKWRHVTLPLAYDMGGKAHTAFGFSGVPALVVLDRLGRVRLTHEGYNGSEMNFRRDLVRFLQTL